MVGKIESIIYEGILEEPGLLNLPEWGVTGSVVSVDRHLRGVNAK